MVFIISTITYLWMVREAWNSVHAVHKQVVQEANLRKQCFERVFLVKFWKSFLILTNINWITGIEFHKLQILEICLLDNCVLYQCWKFNNIRLKPCKDIVREIFGHFEKYGFKVFLRSPRAQIGPMNGEVEGGRGARRRGREVCRKVLHKSFIEYSNTHPSEKC